MKVKAGGVEMSSVRFCGRLFYEKSKHLETLGTNISTNVPHLQYNVLLSTVLLNVWIDIHGLLCGCPRLRVKAVDRR